MHTLELTALHLGMGFGVAKAVLPLGARVVISSSNKSRVDDAVQRLQPFVAAGSGTVEGIQLGGLDEANLKAFFDKVGAFDHLIYTAGDALAIRPFLETPIELLKAQWEVRLWGVVATVKAAHPHLSPQGSITLTGGTSAHRPAKGWSIVAAGAGALQPLARGLAVDLAPIRVNLVEPGATRTEMWGALPDEVRDTAFAQYAERTLLGRVGEVEDTAETFIYLMKADFVTGTNAVVDGGSLLS
ncbi:hypothetical protein PLICRDRAFT_115961 [Plicaturopsis crispa FD-325 SS-3]|nr:hypothetical protein PLICRDRAFT_115961 [Plicaturopsis crispa FD-325 SS-3]